MASPTITFRQFDVTGADPTGERGQETHASFVKELGTANGQGLSFGNNDITISGVNSATRVVVGHMDASGDLTTEMFNMKFWLSSVVAFGNGTTRFNFQKSSGWLQNEVVLNNSLEQVPTSIPSSGNVLRQDGSGIITGSGDSEALEFLYLSIFTGADNSIGVKGGDGRNAFRFRLTADYF